MDSKPDPEGGFFSELLGASSEFVAELVHILFRILKGGETLAQDLAGKYVWVLKKASLYCPIMAGIGILALFVGASLRAQWLIAAAVMLVGLSTAIFLTLSYPIFALGLKLGGAQFARKAASAFISGLLIWTFLLVLYFSVVPVGVRPGAVFVLLILAILFALFWIKFGIGPNPRRLYATLTTVFVLTTASFFFPRTFSALPQARGSLDQFLSQCLLHPVRCLKRDPSIFPHEPRQVSFAELRQLKLYTSDRHPRYWCSGMPGGGYEVFDGPGVHRTTGQALQPVEGELADQVTEWLGTETRRIDEAEREKSRHKAAAGAIAWRNRHIDAGRISPACRKNPCAILGILGEGSSRDLETRLVHTLQDVGIDANAHVFKQAALSGGMFEKLAAGDSKTLTDLGLAGLPGHLLIGRMTASQPQQSSVEGIIYTRLQLSLDISSLANNGHQSTTLNVSGAGPSPSAALEEAEERLLEAIVKDPAIIALRP